MTFDELYNRIMSILPDASIETDNYGQILVYTSLTENDDGTVREMTDADYEGE